MTVIASDKTGTLTENRMSVQQAITADGARYTISGYGYAPDAENRHHGEPVPAPDGLRVLSRAALLCNDADPAAPTADRAAWAAVGEPMEAALVAIAVRCGWNPRRGRADAPRVAEHPFDQATRQ